jgi:hypothetical protein
MLRILIAISRILTKAIYSLTLHTEFQTMQTLRIPTKSRCPRPLWGQPEKCLMRISNPLLELTFPTKLTINRRITNFFAHLFSQNGCKFIAKL